MTVKEYNKMLADYQMIDLTKAEKNTLEAFDKDLADKLINETLSSLTTKMLQWEVSPEYVKGAKFSLYKFSRHFK